MNETTESFLQIEAIFNEAQDAPEHLRPGLIEYRANGDPALVSEVWSLLKACEEAEHVTANRQVDAETGRERSAAPRRIGPYLLDRLLGRGGMGAVYLAHRADGQFKQDVAIKLIDLPLATEVFRERFRQERQILAGLQHPFIARLLDGGLTEDGDPYLVMEYVNGKPIHLFCQQQSLSQGARMELFLRVCEEVQFAHQNLVVHRDLKPDNILVADDATPRLLDFGTAKLLLPDRGSPGSELTREGYQSFTPQYASPEQVLGNPITTASDTYSLGVLLYLLLTGALPYELTELTTAEMLRVVCDRPPRRPAEASALGRHLDADLEAILLKALRKEPQERYTTAAQLAADVRAWLEGRPVAARRGTLRYRAQKFARRHQLGLAGAALLAATVVAGISGVVWQARVANQERRKADARSADLRQLSNSLLSELDEAIKDLPGSTQVQKLLVTRVLEHLDRMAGDAQGDRQTQLDLVDAYTRLGNIQGNPYEQNLGDPAGGLASVGKAIALAQPLAPQTSKDRDALRALAWAQECRSEILFGAARTPEAIASMRAGVAAYERVVALPGVTPALLGDAAAAYGTLGDELGQSGTASMANSADALVALRKAIELDNRALSIDPTFPRAHRGLAIMQMKVGSVEMETNPAQALRDFELAAQRATALPKDQQGTLVTMRMRSMIQRKEANAFSGMGQYIQAQALFHQVESAQQTLAAGDPQDLRSQSDLEVILADEAVSLDDAANPVLATDPAKRAENLVAAQKMWGRVIETTQKMVKQDPSNVNWQQTFADAEVRGGTDRTLLHPSRDSAALAAKGVAALEQMASKPDASPMTLDQAASDLVRVEPASLKNPELAVRFAERLVALGHRQRAAQLLTLSQAYRAAGQADKSRATATEALALLPPADATASKSNIRKLLEQLAKSDR